MFIELGYVLWKLFSKIVLVISVKGFVLNVFEDVLLLLVIEIDIEFIILFGIVFIEGELVVEIFYELYELIGGLVLGGGIIFILNSLLVELCDEELMILL